MKAESKKRFARSIRRYLDSLERDAKAYCYKNDTEYQEVKQYLNGIADEYAKDMVRYQWSEDGEAELCEIEAVTVREETECYHCGQNIAVNSPAKRLTAPDGDVYVIHEQCAAKGCQM